MSMLCFQNTWAAWWGLIKPWDQHLTTWWNRKVHNQLSHQDAVATGPPSGDVRWGKLQPLSSQQPRQRSQKEPAQSAYQHSQSRSFKNHTALRTSLVVYGQLPSNTHVYRQYYFAKIYYCVNLWGYIGSSEAGNTFFAWNTITFQETFLISWALPTDIVTFPKNTRQHGLHVDFDTNMPKVYPTFFAKCGAEFPWFSCLCPCLCHWGQGRRETSAGEILLQQKPRLQSNQLSSWRCSGRQGRNFRCI